MKQEPELEIADEEDLNPFRPMLIAEPPPMVAVERMSMLEDEKPPVLKVECTKEKDSWRLKMYEKQVHNSIVKYNCSLCPKSFSTPSGFRKHFIGIHNPSLKKFVCHCGKAYTTGSELKRHGIYFCKERLPPSDPNLI